MTDLTTLTDTDLQQLQGDVYTETTRRATLATAPAEADRLARSFAAAIGRVDGAEWVPVTGYHDAYPLDAEVTWEGKTWKSTRNGASGIPGSSPDWREVALPNVILEWVQPHAGSEYPVGAVVTLAGRTWRNDHTGPNGWRPGTVGSQWADIGPA